MDEPVDKGARPGRGLRRLVLLVLLVAALAAGWHWRPRPPAPGTHGPFAAGQMPPQPVGAAIVGRGPIHVVLDELGTVTPLATVTVRTQINGRLVAVGFTEGQKVKKGDFLAEIDPRPYQVSLEQAQGQLLRDQSLLAQARADLQRYETLGRQDSISRQQVQDQRFLVGQYTGLVQSDQAQVDGAKLNLTYCHIVSPIDGTVGLRLVDPGNYVQTSDSTGIAVITEMQPISVLFAVPQAVVPELLARLHSGAVLTASAFDQADVTELAQGKLASLDNQINTTTGTLNMRAVFANTDGRLYPNQFVNVHLLLDTLSDVVRVPLPAVQRGAPGTFVYVIGPDHRVSVRVVRLGPVDGAYQAVLDGLRPGEEVVIDGTDRLCEGALVTVPPATPAGGAPPAAALQKQHPQGQRRPQP
jgi:multidrug efflux system membrane fusion protein